MISTVQPAGKYGAASPGPTGGMGVDHETGGIESCLGLHALLER